MLRISKEEPALVIDWDVEAVGALVARANALVTAPAVPDWLTTARPPNITTTSLIGDLVRHLAQFGGGHCGRVVLAPNDMGQYTRLVLELSAVEAHPFLQAAIAGAPTGQRIATTYFMLDHQINQSIPIGRRRSSPARQLFA
ncbi:TPA: hypothetical protein N0F65_012731 [Lagenidium giganteum]|uniref:Uncharacterized protein n=1 Tax=Lagenidium giganteum TaxID=4803 RepID=A0AAV2YED4_9STRA|nr:TPA: hypothetical protein N0F65_012731 [Lagenidium giganteum]